MTTKRTTKKNERLRELEENGWTVLARNGVGTVVRPKDRNMFYGINAAYYTMLRERQEAAEDEDNEEVTT